MSPMFQIRDAYRACFTTPGQRAPRWQFWRRHQRVLTPPSAIVLQDLARVLYANRTTASKDPILMAVAEGRRQAYMHITNRLHLSDEQIERLLSEPQHKPLL